MISRRVTVGLHLLIVVAATVLVYANGYDHAFNLDSGYGLVDNPYVRSLEHIPRYFTDPTTLTVYRANADYRPVLQITYALNYAISEYDMWSWHVVQILLHLVCVIALYEFTRRLLGVVDPGAPRRFVDHTALLAALVFAIHPANAGVVMYLWARSSLLVAAFLLPATVLYLKAYATQPERKRPLVSVSILFTLAIFAKVEAVAAVGVFLLLELLLQVYERDGTRRRGFLRDCLELFNGRTVGRLWPVFVVTAIYAVVRNAVALDFMVEARQSAGMDNLAYLETQLGAWWHYVARWFAPTQLVADDLSYAVSTRLLDPKVLLALGGWLLVAVLLRAVYEQQPHLLLLSLIAAALISPTSSFMPLAEMVNEHRPYLAFGFLSLVWTIPLANLLHRALDRRALQWMAASMVLVLINALGWLTWQRNEVFATSQGYWADILEKSPSSRAHLNYGLGLMRKGDYEGAERHLLASFEMAPRWHLAHINLGALYNRLNQIEKAADHYDRAVDYDQHTSLGHAYRGQFRLDQGLYAAALEDFEAAFPKTIDTFKAHRDITTAYAGLADPVSALEHFEICAKLDLERAGRQIISVATPFWDSGVHYRAGVEFFEGLREQFPDVWWVHGNLGLLYRLTGRVEDAQRSGDRAKELRD